MDDEIKDMFKTFFAVLLALLIAFGGTWAIVNFIVWLISLCFNFTFNFLIGTGLWLCCLLLRFVFASTKN